MCRVDYTHDVYPDLRVFKKLPGDAFQGGYLIRREIPQHASFAVQKNDSRYESVEEPRHKECLVYELTLRVLDDASASEITV